MKGVIICGGKGTRMGNISVPKSLLNVGSKPLLQHHIEWLEKYGINDIVILSGHLSKQIERFVSSLETESTIIVQKESFPLGTAGALKSAEPMLNDTSVVIYGDKMHNLSLDRMMHFHCSKSGVCTIGLHPTTHMFDSDLVDIDDNERVIEIFPKPHDETKYYRNLTNIAVYIITPAIFKYIKSGVFSDFAKDVLPALIKNERVYGYLTTEYMRDIGTPDRLQEVNKDYAAGLITNYDSSSKAIFLDRDGVIVQRCDRKKGDGNDIRNPDEFELYPDTISAIKKINASGYLAIVITNQPGIAKNFFSMSDLANIHNKMETLLGKGGAKLDCIYFCPHHPEKGHPGENVLYKTDCDCRKPKPGLIQDALIKFNIDPSSSYMVGDTWRDIECGKAAGVKTVALLQGDSNWKDSRADFTFETLSDAVDYIIGGNGCKKKHVGVVPTNSQKRS
jgi:histidinol-phosphate phosphatase family protein